MKLKFSFNGRDPASLLAAYEQVFCECEAKDVKSMVVKIGQQFNWYGVFNLYYLARALKETGSIAKATMAAYKAVLLADGFTGQAQPKVVNDRILIPRKVLADFPEVVELLNNTLQSKSALVEKFDAVFVLGGDQGVNTGIARRANFGETNGPYDYWPIDFSKRLNAEGALEELERQAVAACLLDDLAGKLLPASFRKRSRTTDRVVTFGSCFALNLAQSLARNHIQSQTFRIDETINTPRANRLLLDYILHGRETETDFFSRTMPLEKLGELRALISSASLLVLTVGVASVIENAADGRLFITTGSYREALESGVVVQRFTTVEENRDHLVAIVEMIRALNPTVALFITLSPVPLVGVADGHSVLERDGLSKSILRVAIEEAGRCSDFHYWPSFEVVKGVAPHVKSDLRYQAYAEDDRNSRHVSRWLIDIITEKFIEHVFEPAEGG